MFTTRLTRFFRADHLAIAGSFCYGFETSFAGLSYQYATIGACAVSTKIESMPIVADSQYTYTRLSAITSGVHYPAQLPRRH